MAKSIVEFIKKVDVESEVAQALDKDLRYASALTETEIKVRTPVDTGRLKGSMTARKIGFLEYDVQTAVEYAPYVEFGTVRSHARAMMRRGAEAVRKLGDAVLINVKALGK